MSGGNNGRSVEIALVGSLRELLVAALEARYTVHHLYNEPDPLAKLQEIGPQIRGAVGHGMAGLSKSYIELMPNLELFAIHGVGLETTDMAACRERGIVVTITPVLFDDVADLALALALASCRQLPRADRYVREGEWKKGRMSPGRKLTGMRAGIVGLGRIGLEVARRLEGFKTQISYTDLATRDVSYRRMSDTVALAKEVDILFLCAAGPPKGKGPPMINQEVFAALGARGIFINVARGWLVDEAALVRALKSGQLGAAGLDVFDDEPNVPPELLALDNVVLTPHIASATEETYGAMGDNVMANLLSWFSGRGAVTPAGNGHFQS
jgi:lactate dehydrogenase-like 2-hydroxyacid dehydrogenase